MLNIDPARRSSAADILVHLEDIELPSDPNEDDP